MRIYQAGPLFSEAEQNWHRTFRTKLAEAGHRVLWPYELFSQQDVLSWGEDAPARIMETDRNALDTCHVVVALLDGPQVDDGTAWEIGYAYAKGIPVIGIRTDFRQCGDTPHSQVNAMIESSCKLIVKDMEEVIEILEKDEYRKLPERK